MSKPVQAFRSRHLRPIRNGRDNGEERTQPGRLCYNSVRGHDEAWPSIPTSSRFPGVPASQRTRTLTPAPLSGGEGQADYGYPWLHSPLLGWPIVPAASTPAA